MIAMRLIRFVLELTALTVVAVWGFGLDAALPVRILVGVGAPVVLATGWGLFASPRARWFLPLAGRLVVEVIVFGSATWALVALGQPWWAMAFAAVVITNSTLVHARHDVERMREESPGR